MLSVGDRAPPFEGVDQHGASVALEALVREGPVILYFYPRDFTSVCTREACLFRDAHDEMASLSASIVGVSVDDQQTHQRFAERHSLPFSLVADPDRRIRRAYKTDLWPFRRVKRATYVIGRNGIIVGAFRHELSASKHIADVRGVLAKNG